MNLPTDLLRTFVTIADLGGFTRAAGVLGRSQPAISLQIKRLEELVGSTLLTRRGRQLRPTEEGALLLEYARQMLRLNDEAIASIVQPKVAGHIRLGIPNEFAVSVLPQILARFAQSHPGVTLEVSCELSTHLLDGLTNRNFDVVLAIHDEPVRGAQPLWTEELVWVSAPEHDSYGDEAVPLIVAPQGCVYRKRIIDALLANEQPWRIVYTSTSYGGIRAAALAGLGVTALAKSTMPEELRMLTTDGRFPNLPGADVAIHYDQSAVSDATMRLIEHVSSSIQADGSVAMAIPPVPVVQTGDKPATAAE